MFDYLIKEFKRGLISENPIFVLALGLCPALGVSTSVINGLGMGIAATAVLMASNIIISLFRRWIPQEVRIPIFIVIIATFVTIIQMLMAAYLPELNQTLGLFIPLIVVNCVILGRAEAFASKNSIFKSAVDGLVIGAGFTAGLVIISAIREILGANRLFGYEFISGFQPMTIFILAPGGFLAMGGIVGLIQYLQQKERGDSSQ